VPLFEVTFMNHITDASVVEAEDEEAAWALTADDVEGLDSHRWDCTSCQAEHVEPYPSYLTRAWASTGGGPVIWG
jgi:hypothetical protein